MSESVLTYKRGEGWVYLPDDFYCEALTSDGVKAKVYKRDPVVGDCWCGRYETDTEEIMLKYTKLWSVEDFRGRAWKETDRLGIRKYYVFEFDE